MRATKFRGRRIARILLSALAAGAVICGGVTAPALAATSLPETTAPTQLPAGATTPPIPAPSGFVVAGPFAKWYSQAIATSYGPPIANQSCPSNLLCTQDFQNGTAFWQPTLDNSNPSAQGVLRTTPTGAKYFADGGYAALGLPLGEEVCTAPHGGCYQWFEKGITWWSPTTAAATVRTDGFQALYEQKNWAWGPMGYPLGDINCMGPGGGCYQWFQGGIVWSATSPGYFGSWVHGAIEAKFAQLGWAWGTLGYPHLEEMCGYGYTDGGCVQYFDNGQIVWSLATGASMIHGAIGWGWLRAGYYGGIGYPTGDEQCTAPNSGCYQWFQKGVYFWSAATGAHYVKGAIKSTYEGLGWSWGRLGYPTSDESGAWLGNEIRQDFEHGSITWTPYSGIKVIWR
ncbi:hypothetical protein GCM10023346_00340 [Arthrobacter gyeryongensis]|uniref:LGFP repeat-containing protein n=1 Tax=Arthrobacter gyeryongensis TaxID=1650592 RepID=A0ABP9RWE0_9MICC